VAKSQYEVCVGVLRRLRKEGVLEHVVLIGSWCVLFHEDFFRLDGYYPTIRTRDIDILVPVPPRIPVKVDLPSILREMDFVMELKGSRGFMQFLHPDLLLEFLVPGAVERTVEIDPGHEPIPRLRVQLDAVVTFLEHLHQFRGIGVELHGGHQADVALDAGPAHVAVQLRVRHGELAAHVGTDVPGDARVPIGDSFAATKVRKRCQEPFSPMFLLLNPGP